MTIKDDVNNPSLLIQAIHSAGNNETTVVVRRIDNNNFDLIVQNSFRRDRPLEIQFTDLSLENVEEKVNGNLSPQSFIYVEKVGNKAPAPGVYNLDQTYKMVIHELHTPIIGIPFLHFAHLVQRRPELVEFLLKAKTYIRAMEKSALDYERSWVDEGKTGYYIFEKNTKFWASGLPVPYNALSANGRFFLKLYLATGKEV